MNRLIWVLSILSLSCTECFATDASPAQVIELTRAEDIRDVLSVHEAIGKMSAKVSECVKGKLAPADECACRYPMELAELRKTYEKVLVQHPEWKDKLVSYNSNGGNSMVGFDGLREQFERKCP